MAEDCLKKIKNCCKVQMPFHLENEVESAVDIAEDCLEKMNDCLKLSKKLTMFKSYESEKNLTKKDTVVNAMRRFNDGLKDLRSCLKGIRAELQAKRFECPQCHGSRTITKRVYFRESGTPPQIFSKDFPCDYCNGRGYVAITAEVRNSVNIFYEKANELALTFKNFYESLNLFISACAHEKIHKKHRGFWNHLLRRG